MPLMERLLPRHMQIIYLINALHLDGLRAAGRGDRAAAVGGVADRRAQRTAGAHGPSRLPRLAPVNGVSALHTDLMRETVFRDLHALYPDRIVNVTNGITFRRWLFEANPEPDRAAGRDARATGARRRQRRWSGFAALGRRSRRCSSGCAAVRRRQQGGAGRAGSLERLEIRVDPDALFDVQIKRIHEYKRQLLNILETIALLRRASAPQPTRDWVPRVKIFAGKAAASYQRPS